MDYLGLGLFSEAFLAFVCEEMWRKGPIEQLRCVFVVSTCVDSENGDLLLMVKGKVY